MLFWVVFLIITRIVYLKIKRNAFIIYSPSCRSKPGWSFFLETHNEILGRISTLQFSTEQKQKFVIFLVFICISEFFQPENILTMWIMEIGDKILFKLFIFMIISSKAKGLIV